MSPTSPTYVHYLFFKAAICGGASASSSESVSVAAPSSRPPPILTLAPGSSSQVGSGQQGGDVAALLVVQPVIRHAVPNPKLLFSKVAVKRGQTYSRCLADQSSTANAPCEAGVIASDSVDGASIQNRVRPECL